MRRHRPLSGSGYHGSVRLVLASASPRRRELLLAAGFTFDTLVVDIDETVRSGESASAYVRRLATEKSAAAWDRIHGPAKAGHYVPDGPAARPERRRGEAGHDVPDGRAQAGPCVQSCEPVIVLGADTAVVVDGEILGKPRDDVEAASMLRRLSGRGHEVMTGVSLRSGDLEVGRVDTTVVHVAALTEADVSWYVASGEGRDKAGAYAIQGLASRFIPRIEGSYSNVVGLPVACVADLLHRLRSG